MYEIFPKDLDSVTSTGFFVSSLILYPLIVDAILFIDTCFSKMDLLSKLLIHILLLLDSLSDKTVLSTEDLSNFVKSKLDDRSFSYVPSAKIFAY